MEERFPVQEGDALRPCRMEDIVVLMRSPAGRAFELGRALEEQGIPCSADTTGDFFATMEVAVIYNLLQIVDNPRQDVPLISVLRSPLAGFTPDPAGPGPRRHSPGGFLRCPLRRRGRGLRLPSWRSL